jgi:hypothetical protein
MTYPLVGSRYAPKGWPDRLICYDGNFFMLEFKTEDGKLRSEQIEVITKLREQEAPVFVARVRDGKPPGILLETVEGVCLTDWFNWGQFFVQYESIL